MSSNPGPKYKRKPRQTVAIPDERLYERVKTRAAEKGLTMQDYVSDTLLMNIEKDDFLKEYAPHLSARIAEDAIYVKDSKLGRTAEVVMKDGRLMCYFDEKEDCEHIHFALALPQIAKLHNIKTQAR